MELKKSPKADLNNKKGIFTLTGLCVALLITIGVFSTSETEQVIEQLQTSITVSEADLDDVTVQEEEKKPEPEKTKPMAASELINIVKNDTKIEHDMSMFDELDDFDLDMEVSYGDEYSAEEEIVEETPVLFAEESAMFDGKDGAVAFSHWCQANLKYPPLAIDNGIQGRVIISFVVEPTGKLSNIKILRGVDKELDQAALEIVKKSPLKWVAAKNNGRPVRLLINIPIVFQLEQ